MAEEDTNWEYKPSGGVKAPHSTKSVNWTASEYIDHKQGPGWYALLTLATVVLAAIVYLMTKDYFATGIIVLVGVIVGLFAHRRPRELKYELSNEGLRVEDKLYPLQSFKSFTLFREGPVGSLEFTPLKRFMPPVSVYFELTDEKKILNLLENFLPYEERQPDSIDRLSRRLRF